MGGQGGHAYSPIFLKSCLAKDAFLEISFCVISQGIQTILAPALLESRREPFLECKVFLDLSHF